MRKASVKSPECAARILGLRTPCLLAIIAGLVFSGCVRVAGTAGYWHSDTEGEGKAKQVGFDTTDFVPGH